MSDERLETKWRVAVGPKVPNRDYNDWALMYTAMYQIKKGAKKGEWAFKNKKVYEKDKGAAGKDRLLRVAQLLNERGKEPESGPTPYMEMSDQKRRKAALKVPTDQPNYD